MAAKKKKTVKKKTAPKKDAPRPITSAAGAAGGFITSIGTV
jgi:hypothetical protein